MEHKRCFALVLFFLWMGLSAHSSSADSVVSDDIFESHVSQGRTLLEGEEKLCPVNFECQNYTILTSQCKEPEYPPSRCCPAFKEFVCPLADLLNDLSNNCARSMFCNINLRYPPGLFANECREGKRGLACPYSPPPAQFECPALPPFSHYDDPGSDYHGTSSNFDETSESPAPSTTVLPPAPRPDTSAA